ncbi:MAG: hypothetical protein V4466_12995 [Pseudomonadota bacterium]
MAETLHLACEGVGSRLEQSTTYGNADSSTGASISGSTTSYYRERSQATVTVEIADDQGRIQMPSALLPPLRGGGQNGWWQFDQLTVGEDEILGRFSLNVLNKPKVRIDRRTGQISISGFAKLGFEGECRPFDPAPEARRF